MALIDIIKLNEELDKMIEGQEAEIEQIENEILERNEHLYDQMVKELAELNKVALEIGERINVPIGINVDGWNYTIELGWRRSFRIISRNYLGISHICHPFRFDYAYETCDILDATIKWWNENSKEFTQRFEEECIKAIKDKAERANTKYQEALNRKESIR